MHYVLIYRTAIISTNRSLGDGPVPLSLWRLLYKRLPSLRFNDCSCRVQLVFSLNRKNIERKPRANTTAYLLDDLLDLPHADFLLQGRNAVLRLNQRKALLHNLNTFLGPKIRSKGKRSLTASVYFR